MHYEISGLTKFIVLLTYICFFVIIFNFIYTLKRSELFYKKKKYVILVQVCTYLGILLVNHDHAFMQALF